LARNPAPDDPVARGLVRAAVCRLVRRGDVRPQDRADWEQQLALELRRRPALGPPAGVTQCLLNAALGRIARNLLRRARARKRDDRGVASLSSRVATGEGTRELAATVERDRRSPRPRTDEECAALAMDVAAVLSALTPEERELAERLMAQTVTEVARACGLPRSTVADRVRRLRQKFEQSALRKYL
jgi:RNA polymerase sigma factor (sigma-70 family)